MNRHGIRATALAVLLLPALFPAVPPLRAAETEHLDLQVLPAPGPVTVDGKTDD